ncbi:hypothetical protein BGZ80_011484 [Entomortierella chlamydospora]|uniref:HMG box domain-containing protein n=1 Tax=Entomortierella chlamydospora TaxID=101097 RepID=A0A9P6SZ89_9FUNG|nr:hypothetical protein BGZ80_011484 [Entomortierella chlamydospora]
MKISTTRSTTQKSQTSQINPKSARSHQRLHDIEGESDSAYSTKTQKRTKQATSHNRLRNESKDLEHPTRYQDSGSQFELDTTSFVRLLSQPTTNADEDMDGSEHRLSPLTGTSWMRPCEILDDEDPVSSDSTQRCSVRITRSSSSRKRITSAEPKQTRRSIGSALVTYTTPEKKESCTALSVAGRFSNMNLDASDSDTSTSAYVNYKSGSISDTSSVRTTHSQVNPDSSSATPASSGVSFEPSLYFPLSASAIHQKRRKARRHAIRVPRPKNCFMLYRSKVLPMIMAELGAINNKIISKIAAERWRAESEPVKAWYRQMAKQGKEEHAKNNPGYRYAPHKKTAAAARGKNSRKQNGRRRDGDSDSDGHDDGEVDIEDVASLAEERANGDEETILETNNQKPRRSPRKTSSTVSSKVGKRARLDGDESYSFSQITMQDVDEDNDDGDDGDDDDDMTYHSRGQGRHSENARIRGGRNGSTPKRRSKLNKNQGSDELICCPTNGANSGCINEQSAPTLFPGLRSSTTPIPLLGYSLIDQQQLFLAIQQQQNESLRLLQQQQQQQQYQQLSALLQAQTFLPFPGGQVPDQSTLYSLSGDGNGSASTLVDPISHWMTHCYHGGANHYSAPNSQTSIGHTIEGTFGKQIPPLFHSVEKTGQVNMTNKELPPLPHEALMPTSFDDPCSIMSQLFAQYNANISWERPASSIQEYPIQLFAAAKEPNPAPAMWNVSLATGSASCEQQWESQPGSLQDDQLQQYLIKPACPASFMSFADVGQGSMSMMDVFSWPSDSSSSISDNSKSSDSSNPEP